MNNFLIKLLLYIYFDLVIFNLLFFIKRINKVK